MKRSTLLILLGILIIIGGIGYDLLFAGIPYQDPTPEMVARYTLHAQIAGAIRWLGVAVAVIGGGIAFVHRGTS